MVPSKPAESSPYGYCELKAVPGGWQLGRWLQDPDAVPRSLSDLCRLPLGFGSSSSLPVSWETWAKVVSDGVDVAGIGSPPKL